MTARSRSAATGRRPRLAGRTLTRDEQGYVLTGRRMREGNWTVAGRGPFARETGLPGVFAAGDVRAGSARRVGAAAGEGPMAVQLIHEYLRDR